LTIVDFEEDNLQKTLQIATVGTDSESVMIGMRNAPTHKLALICLKENEKEVRDLAREIEQKMKLGVSVYSVQENVIEAVMQTVAEIVKENRSQFNDIVVNVAGGEKVLTCAAVSAAFVNGIKAFHLRDEMAVMLPVLKFSYSKLLSNTKISILRLLEDAGGQIDSLEALANNSIYSKSLLSYHIRGSLESKGLDELGLVETSKMKRGRIQVTLTTQGRIVLNSV
jgi:hypothetical protein